MARNSVSLTTPQASHRSIIVVGKDTFALRAVGDITKHFVDLIEDANDFKNTAGKVLESRRVQTLSPAEVASLKDVLAAVDGDLAAVATFLKPALVADPRASVAAVRYKTLKEGRQVVALDSRLASTIDNINIVMKQILKKSKANTHSKEEQSRPTSRPIANERRHRQSSQSCASITTSISSITVGDDATEHAKAVPANAESTSISQSNLSGNEAHVQVGISSNSDRLGSTGNHHPLHPINELEGDVPSGRRWCRTEARIPSGMRVESQPEMSNTTQDNVDDLGSGSGGPEQARTSTNKQDQMYHLSKTTQTSLPVPERSHAEDFAELRRRHRETREHQRELLPFQTSFPLCTARGDLYSTLHNTAYSVVNGADAVADRYAGQNPETALCGQSQRDSGYYSPPASILNSPGVVNQTVWKSPGGLLNIDVLNPIKRSDTVCNYYMHNPLGEDVELEHGQDATLNNSARAPQTTSIIQRDLQAIREERFFQVMSEDHISYREPHHGRAASDSLIPTLSIHPSTPTEQNQAPFQQSVARHTSLVVRKPVPLSINSRSNLTNSVIQEEDPIQDHQHPTMNPRLAEQVQPVRIPQHGNLPPPPPPPPRPWAKPEQSRDRVPGANVNIEQQIEAPTYNVEDLARRNDHLLQTQDNFTRPSEPLRRALAQEARRHNLRNATNETASHNEYLDRARTARQLHAFGGALPVQPDPTFAGDLRIPGPNQPGRVSPLTPEQRRSSPHRPTVSPSYQRTTSIPQVREVNTYRVEPRFDTDHPPNTRQSEDEFENPVVEDAQEVPVVRLTQLSMHSAPFTHSHTNSPQRVGAQNWHQSQTAGNAMPRTRADQRATTGPPPPPPPLQRGTQPGQKTNPRPAVRAIMPPGRINTSNPVNSIQSLSAGTPTSPVSRVVSPPPAYSTYDANNPPVGLPNIPNRRGSSRAGLTTPSSPLPSRSSIHHIRLSEGQRSHSDPTTTTTQASSRPTFMPPQAQPPAPTRSEPRVQQQERQRRPPRTFWWHSPQEVGPLSPT